VEVDLITEEIPDTEMDVMDHQEMEVTAVVIVWDQDMIIILNLVIEVDAAHLMVADMVVPIIVMEADATLLLVDLVMEIQVAIGVIIMKDETEVAMAIQTINI
jgi:hypothetical protein